MTTKEEVWTPVWLVMAFGKARNLYGPVAGVYTTEEAAREHARTGDFEVVEWAASNRYHQS